MKRLVFAALALALSLSGCSSGLTVFSNYRRIENIELIRTVTVDAAEEGVNVSICGTAGEESEARMYEKSGTSLGVAIGELILLPLGRDAILSHTENMLIGEEFARDRLAECLDYIERFSEMRLDTGVLIVRDGAARDLLAGLSGKETPASDTIAGLAKNISRMGQGYFFTCREVASSLAKNGCALIQCVRGVKEEKLFDERGDLNLQPAGFAVVRGSAVTDYLDDQESLGCLLLMGKFKSRNIDLDMDGRVLTVSVDLVKTDIKPVFSKDGRLETLKIDFSCRANVINMSAPIDITDRRVRAQAQDELTCILTGAIRAAIDRSQAIGVDFLDLQGVVERKEPLKLADMKTGWASVFPTLPVEISGDSTLARTYDITDPPELSGKEEGKDPWEKLTESLKDS